MANAYLANECNRISNSFYNCTWISPYSSLFPKNCNESVKNVENKLTTYATIDVNSN